MHLIRLFVLTTSLLFLPCTTFASIAWLPEETPSLRRNTYPLTDEEYQKFEDAKKFYYKDLLKDVPTPQEIPFFELTHSLSQQKFFMLGTYHGLPFECLPQWFLSFLETHVDEVYLESRFCTSFAAFGKNPTAIQEHISPMLQKEISDFLTPLLSVFSKNLESLNLGELYSFMMRFDALFGMDATIELASLKLKKPLFMLDKEIDMISSNITFHKDMLKQELSSSLPPERQAHVEMLLKSSGDELIKTYIEEEFKTVSQEFTDTINLRQELNQALLDWSKEPIADEEPGEVVNFTSANVLERNVRWVMLLNNTSPSRKLVAIGAGHLLDLFERFKALGYEIKRYSPG